jgi:hypothetical protein
MANAKFTLLEKKTTDDNKQSDCIIKNAGDFKKTRHFTESFAACLAKIFHIFPLFFFVLSKMKKMFFQLFHMKIPKLVSVVEKSATHTTTTKNQLIVFSFFLFWHQFFFVR